MKKAIIICLITFFVSSGNAQDSISLKQAESNTKALSVLWQQHAAEYRALCYQAFNIAALRLQESLKANTGKKKPAIITDLDETILDNSYSEAQLIKEGNEYKPETWKRWTDKSAATGVPGAVDFLRFAKQKGVSVFYISNRDINDVTSTLRNLQKLNLPDADTAHMLFKSSGSSSSKEARRQLVMNRYNVIMLLGDNLGDFTELFDRKNIADRKTETDKVKNEWGKKFIVLPNATYGEWENALYDYERLSPAQKDSRRKLKLIGY